jgi:hypothetical protein
MRVGDVLEIHSRGLNMTPEVWDALIAACGEVARGYEAIKAERERKATKGRKR